MHLFIGFIVSILVAGEIFKWAKFKIVDNDDESAVKARKRWTCCACLPLGNCLMWFLTILQTFGAAGTIHQGVTATRPLLTVAPGLLLVAIAMWVVMCSDMKDTVSGRMAIFWS